MGPAYTARTKRHLCMAHATFCRRPNAMRNIKGQSRWCLPCLQGREHGEGYQYHWTQQTDMGMTIEITEKHLDYHETTQDPNQIKVTIVPAYSKSVCDARKKATEQLDEVNINRETNLPPYLTRVIPSDPTPGAGSVRITQDRWFLGSGSFVEPSFDPGSPRIAQDCPDRVGQIVRGIGPWCTPVPYVATWQVSCAGKCSWSQVHMYIGLCSQLSITRDGSSLTYSRCYDPPISSRW